MDVNSIVEANGVEAKASITDTQPVTPEDLLCSNESNPSESCMSPPSWGTVYAMKPEFYTLDLTNDLYVFGRKSDCDYSFDMPSIRKNPHFKLYSKKQFSISRSLNPDGSTLQVFIKDLGGTNGTFVNGVKMKPLSTRPLLCKDKISLSISTNEVFLYVSKDGYDGSDKDDFSSKYIVSKQLGSGACGEVCEVWLKQGFGQFACKIIKKGSLSICTNNSKIMAEANILKQLDHSGVIGIIDVLESPTRLYIILEYAAGGDLFNRVAKKGALPEALAKVYFFQMLQAIMYLHSNGITHRDLKPENVLLMSCEEPSIVKLTDFGISRFVPEESLMHTLAGTPSYLPPELVQQVVFKSSAGYTELIDMWSLGVILFVCLVAYRPFDSNRHDTKKHLHEQILTADFNFDPSPWKKISSSAKDLITCLLKVNITERFNSKQTFGHVWLKDSEMKEKVNKLVKIKDEVLLLMNERSLSNTSVDTRKVSTDTERGSNFSHSSQPCKQDDASLSGNIESSDDSLSNLGIKRHIESNNSNEPLVKHSKC